MPRDAAGLRESDDSPARDDDPAAETEGARAVARRRPQRETVVERSRSFMVVLGADVNDGRFRGKGRCWRSAAKMWRRLW
mmetsp:Transcript_41388/g.125307  ORF Transcript_41388/g.125307 Transcript_41388/m.125307 type:complete len:80 (+) Transcript_41388:1436-1675(+)